MTLLLRQYRRANSLDQHQLARRLGVTYYDVRRAEAGDVVLPRPLVLRDLEEEFRAVDRLLETVDSCGARPSDQETRARLRLAPPPDLASFPHALGPVKFAALVVCFRHRKIRRLAYPGDVCPNPGVIGQMVRDGLLERRPNGVALTQLGLDVMFVEYYRLRPSARLALGETAQRDVRASRHPPLSVLLGRMGCSSLEEAVDREDRLSQPEAVALAALFNLTREIHGRPPQELTSSAASVRSLHRRGLARVCRGDPERYYSSREGRDRASLEYYAAAARGEHV